VNELNDETNTMTMTVPRPPVGQTALTLATIGADGTVVRVDWLTATSDLQLPFADFARRYLQPAWSAIAARWR
jgi:hypothetical protein